MECDQKMMAAFGDVLRAEKAIAAAKAELAETTNRLKLAIAEAEKSEADAWQVIADLMKETGEYEVILPGAVTDYKIGWSRPSKKVVADAEATPDELCDIKRKPKLKEIGEHLKVMEMAGWAMPNWARFEAAESKLTWKAIKRSVK